MDTLTVVVKILEGVSYVLTIGLFVVAILGLQQIRVARKQITIARKQITIARKSLSLESKRDSLRVTDNQITQFFNTILPSYEQNLITTRQLHIRDSFTLDDDGEIDYKAIKKAHKERGITYSLATKADKDKYENDIRKVFDVKRQSFNMIEAFSSSFVSGLADEKAAYMALGPAYCDIMKRYIHMLRHYNKDGYYKRSITLYNLWSKRLAREHTERELHKLENEVERSDETLKDTKDKLQRLKDEISTIEDEEIISIGTES